MIKNYDLFAVANYILDNGTNMTNLKFQKLLFFFFGIHSCVYNNFPFDDDIEAWQYGPVNPTTYKELRDSGANIVTNRLNISMEEGECDFPKLDDKDLIQSAKITLIYYDRFSARELVNKSHKLDCWKTKFLECPKSKMNAHDIKAEFYTKIMPDIVEYLQ